MDTENKFHLRQLPLPAKLVVSVFLMAVGLGYLSAMIQLHFKHASKGEVAPTLDDVVIKFSGQLPPWKPIPVVPEKPVENPSEGKIVAVKVKTILTDRCAACHSKDGGEEPELDTWDRLTESLGENPAKGKIYKLVSADREAKWGKDSSMRAAFHEKGFINGTKWKDAVKSLDEAGVKNIAAERELERIGLVAWLEAGAPKQAYDNDSFTPEAGQKVSTGDIDDPVAKARRRQMEVENLTQSTHAHLLSFSVLWALTGLVFAFTSYPLWMRVGIAPIVLIAQIGDVLCWWLARLPDSGPYFAAAIIGTGGIVGMGLAAQIVLSLFNMYGLKGKFVLILVFALGIAGLGAVGTKYFKPVLDQEKAEVVQKAK